MLMFVQQIGLNIITEMVIGYIYPGRPLANVTFKTYGYISMAQALGFLSDFKLGHYMKIPPKSMFVVQVTDVTIILIRSIDLSNNVDISYLKRVFIQSA